tara:strand:- start:453 stop:1571 length:1119 start_codon:yes stop_codon:yes gene_type:complete
MNSPDVYKKLGIEPVINAQSWVTVLGGSLMKPEVLSAMNEASSVFVDMIKLNKSAGDFIAKICNAEKGLITSGCAAAQVLMVSACMTGKDESKIDLLPSSDLGKNQVLLHSKQRNRYEKSFTMPGATIVEFSSEKELKSLISNKTACVAYVLAPWLSRGLGLSRTIDLAHEKDVPIIMDAAAELPPRANLSKFIDMGVDLVAFSGGKGIQGPQSTGFLAGKKDLVDAAFMNSLNLHAELAAIGRPMKVSKENIVGLVTALEMFIDTDESKEWSDWLDKSKRIKNRIENTKGIKVTIEDDEETRQGPTVVIRFGKNYKGPSLKKILFELENGKPNIFVSTQPHINEISLIMVNIQDGEDIIIAERLTEILEKS